MIQILIPILTFLLGFTAKKLFDDRDLRRKMLEPVFEEFDTFLNDTKLAEEDMKKAKTQKNKANLTRIFNETRTKIKKMEMSLIFVCKRINERKLEKITREVFTKISESTSSYYFFLENRDNDFAREDVLKAYDRAKTKKVHEISNGNFSKEVVTLYQRYWCLISGVFINFFGIEIRII